MPLGLDVLSDILANPSFDADELEREKGVIEQEIGAAQDTPDDVVFEHLNELCYPDQPMGARCSARRRRSPPSRATTCAAISPRITAVRAWW